MKAMNIKGIIFAVILGMVLPWVLLMKTEKSMISDATEGSVTQPKVQAYASIMVGQSEETAIQMDLEAYILGVLIGEMPAGFDVQALKAQAVVARTFAIKSINTGYKHKNYDVCTDSSCCQSFYNPDKYLSDGGSEEELNKFQTAVEDTVGQVLLYEGKLIEATYFSCSGGKTEDAKAVWGTDIPYLKALDSPGEENAAHFTDTVVFTAGEFESKIGEKLDGLPGTWIGNVTYTNGQGVATIQIGNKTYSGTQIRKMLGLRSTAFVISIVGDRVTITTKGFGHRVGMSQYGADAMAVQGYEYKEILDYYYPGTSLSDYRQV